MMMFNTLVEKMQKGQAALIAEVGVNYYDIAAKMKLTPMEAALFMVDEAKRVNIHAVKFQTYKANTLAAKNSPSYWDTSEETTRSQYELFRKFDSFGKDEYEKIALHCEKAGIEFLSTPFDFDSADYLYEMMNVYKISSSDLSNLPFIKHMAKKNKPILLSTGASDLAEIETAVNVIQQYNAQPLGLLHCVLEYPTPYSHANLNKIVSLQKHFPHLTIGYSDHTKPEQNYDTIKTAYNLGAAIIEKHFTLDKTLKGNDHYHAMDPQDAQNILEGLAYIDTIRGSYDIVCLESERTARSNARRSIIAARNIKKGEAVTEDKLIFKRPGTGISPSQIHEVIGKTALVDIEEDTILTFEMLG